MTELGRVVAATQARGRLATGAEGRQSIGRLENLEFRNAWSGGDALWLSGCGKLGLRHVAGARDQLPDIGETVAHIVELDQGGDSAGYRVGQIMPGPVAFEPLVAADITERAHKAALPGAVAEPVL